MSKGIRAYTVTRFAKHLVAFVAAELTARDFRRKVCNDVAKKFDISLSAAGAHYNYALQSAKLADPKAVEGLGRPEDKKGGRKVLNPVTVVKAKSGEVVAEGVSKGAATLMIAKAAAKRGVAKLAIAEVDEAA